MRTPDALLLWTEVWGHLQAHAGPAASAQHAAAASPFSPRPGQVANTVAQMLFGALLPQAQGGRHSALQTALGAV